MKTLRTSAALLAALLILLPLSPAEAGRTKKPARLRAMTFNIRYDFETAGPNRWEHRVERVAKAIALGGADAPLPPALTIRRSFSDVGPSPSKKGRESAAADGAPNGHGFLGAVRKGLRNMNAMFRKRLPSPKRAGTPPRRGASPLRASGRRSK